MATATILPLNANPLCEDLEAQRSAFGDATPDLLVVRCGAAAAGEPGWLAAVGPAFQLRSGGVDVEDALLREAIHAAVEGHGVRSLLLVLPSPCAHVAAAAGLPAPGPDAGPSFMDRLYENRARTQAGLDAVRDRMRMSIRTLTVDPMLEGVECTGLVHILESGVMLAYDPDRDRFEALL